MRQSLRITEQVCAGEGRGSTELPPPPREEGNLLNQRFLKHCLDHILPMYDLYDKIQ